MLVVTRKINESIVIVDDRTIIEITVCRINRNSVRLGVKAPKKCVIARKELIRAGDGEATCDGPALSRKKT